MVHRKLLLFCMLSFMLAIVGCAKPSVEEVQKEKAAAEEVIREFEATQANVTYADPDSFTKGDPYLTQEFAAQYHEMRAGMKQFIMDSKATVSGAEPTITFMKQEGDDYVYTLESQRTITSEVSKDAAISQIHYIVTVTKQKDGGFLISNMEEHK